MVDVSTRTLRRWTAKATDQFHEETGEPGWEYGEFHGLRRTWATRLRSEDVDAMVVCDWGGITYRRSSTTPRERTSRRHNVESGKKSSGCNGARDTRVCTQRIHMSTIRVSDEVKERLRDLKREDESFNDLLDRLSRTEKDVEQIADNLSSIGGESFEEDMQDAHDELNESLEERIGR